MICRKPFRRGVFEFGCGQCMNCRYNKRRVWTHRILLESFQEKPCSFVTLTYSDDKLPIDKSLNPAHTQGWLKRLRRAVAPTTLRFFLVGEYGDQTQRPHYHIALFGIGACVYGNSWLTGKQCVCPNCNLISRTWGFGGVSVDNLEADSAAYIVGYVTKKMTSVEDERLCGRHPEFARMSLKPGIGALAIDDVIAASPKNLLQLTGGDVPSGLRHGSKEMPFGRYLKEKYRVGMGVQQFKIAGKVGKRMYTEFLGSVGFKAQVQMQELRLETTPSKEKQKVLNRESKLKLYKKGKWL